MTPAWARGPSLVPDDSAHHARSPVVEGPAGQQELHAEGVVAGVEGVLQVQLVGGGQLVPVDLDTQAGSIRDRDRR